MKGFISVTEIGAVHSGQTLYVAVDDIRTVGQYWNWESEERWTGTTEITFKDESHIHVWDSVGSVITKINDATEKHEGLFRTFKKAVDICHKYGQNDFDWERTKCSDKCPFRKYNHCGLKAGFGNYPDTWELFRVEELIAEYEQNEYVKTHPQVDPEADEEEAHKTLKMGDYYREPTYNRTQSRLVYNSARLRQKMCVQFSVSTKEWEAVEEARKALEKMEDTLELEPDWVGEDDDEEEEDDES